MAPWKKLDDMGLRVNVAVLISGIGLPLLILWIATSRSTNIFSERIMVAAMIAPPIAALGLKIVAFIRHKSNWGEDVKDFLHKWCGMLAALGFIAALYLKLPWLLLVALPYTLILVWWSTGKSKDIAQQE